MANPSLQRQTIAAKTQQKLGRAERRRRALNLRKTGFSYRQIAEQLDVTVKTAYNDVQHELKAITKEPAEQVLEIELNRLDDLLRVTSAVAFDASRKAGDRLGAIDRALRIMDRRAKYLGIDEPKAVNESEEVQKALLDLKEVAKQFAEDNPQC